jgi:hypothetical protein
MITSALRSFRDPTLQSRQVTTSINSNGIEEDDMSSRSSICGATKIGSRS